MVINVIIVCDTMSTTGTDDPYMRGKKRRREKKREEERRREKKREEEASYELMCHSSFFSAIHASSPQHTLSLSLSL